MGLIQMVKDFRKMRYYNALSDKVASLEEANIPELTALREKWDRLKTTINRDKDKIDRKERTYRSNLREEQNHKRTISNCKRKMRQIRRIPILSRLFLNVAQLWGNPRALEYASYKRNIENSKERISVLREDRAYILADINEMASKNEQSKIELQEIEQAIVGKYNAIKHDLKDIVLFENNKKMLENKLSKEAMRELQDIIQTMKKGKDLPEGVDKKQVMALMKKVIDQKDSNDNKDNQQDQQNQQQDSTRGQQDQNYRDGLKDWPAVAFAKYQVDRNKLANALRSSSTKDPVEFLCALGKMSIGDKAKENGISDRVLLNKGLHILQAAIEGKAVDNKIEEKAYKIACTLIKSSGDIRMDSAIPQNDTRNQDNSLAR